MSILDGMPRSAAEAEGALKIAFPFLDRIIDRLELPPKQQSIIDLMREGLSLADICKITKEHRDAMLVQGGLYIKQGQLDKAIDWLAMLHQLEPLDERVIYTLAVAFQLKGDFARAGKLFANFVALDATNAEGYLRLGECCLAAGEHDNAADCFRFAKAESERGNGSAKTTAYAARMLAYVDARRAAAS
jgi:tetratricopeptide (TPR) repeat protein